MAKIDIELVNVQTKALVKELERLTVQLAKTEAGSDEHAATLKELTQIQESYKASVAQSVQTNQALEGSYDALTKEMSALKKEWRATNDEAKRNDLGERIAEINQQLKDYDATIGNFQRNVGSYNEAIKPVAQQLGEIEDEMRQMLANGVSPLDDGFKELAKQAGVLKNAQDSVGRIIDQNARVTSKFADTVSVLNTGISLVSAYEGAMASFGVENEKVAKTLAKLNGLMAISNSLNQINEALADKSSGTYKLFNAILSKLGLIRKADTAATQAHTTATAANTAVTVEATAATTALTAAINWKKAAVMATVAVIAAIVLNWEKFKGGVEKTTSAIRDFVRENKFLMNGLHGLLTAMGGVYSAISLIIGQFDKLRPVIDKAVGSVKEFFKDKDRERLDKALERIEEMTYELEKQSRVMEAQGKNEREILEYRLKEYQKQLDILVRLGKMEDSKEEDRQKEIKAIRERIRGTQDEIELYDIKLKYAKKDTEETRNTVDAKKEELRLDTQIYERQKELNDLTTEYLITKGDIDELEAEQRVLENLKAEGRELDNNIRKVEEYIKKHGEADGAGETLSQLRHDRDTNTIRQSIQATIVDNAKNDKTIDGINKKYGEILSSMDFEIGMMEAQGMSEEKIHQLTERRFNIEQAYYNELIRNSEGEDRYAIEQEKIAKFNEWTISEAKRASDLKKQIEEDEQARFEENMAKSIDAAHATAGILSIVGEMMEENTRKKVEDGKITEEQAKKEFERVKKIQIAVTTMETLSGTVTAFMETLKLYGKTPWGFAIAAANAAMALATGMAQVQQIRNQTIGGTGGAAANVSAGLQMQAVTPLLNEQNDINAMTELGIQSGAGTDKRVYILETDILDTVNRAEVREYNSEL